MRMCENPISRRSSSFNVSETSWALVTCQRPRREKKSDRNRENISATYFKECLYDVCGSVTRRPHGHYDLLRISHFPLQHAEPEEHILSQQQL